MVSVVVSAVAILDRHAVIKTSLRAECDLMRARRAPSLVKLPNYNLINNPDTLLEIQFYSYLQHSHVGKNPKCDENDDAIDYCQVDGYLMVIDPFSSIFAPTLSDDLMPNDEAWVEFLIPMDLKLTDLQNHSRALELFGPNSGLCNNIGIRLFKRTRGQIVRLTVDELRNRDSFVIELLETSTMYYIHPTKSIVAFASTDATVIHNLKGYVYLTLVCSDIAGGGRTAIRQLASFCHLVQARAILLSALSNVVWYYFNKFDAKFINRQGQIIDVSPYAQLQPIPRRYA